MAEQQQDVDTLKRRGRRRLVGAVALVLLAVIVLPMVFDPEPRQVAPPVSVRIPGEDETPFKPKPPAQKPAPSEKKEPEKKRSEEHTSELQSLRHLVCRLLLEKKNTKTYKEAVR